MTDKKVSPATEIRRAAEVLRDRSTPEVLWISAMSDTVAVTLSEVLDSTRYAIENDRCPADRLAPVLRLARQINEATA